MHLPQSQTVGFPVPSRSRHHCLHKSIDLTPIPHDTWLGLKQKHQCAMSERAETSCSEELLSVWNQCAPRVYLCVVLCFPYDNKARVNTIHHLRHALRRLAAERPIFAGRLVGTRDGKVILRRSRSNHIPFEVVHNTDKDDIDYAQMRREEFPPGSFVHPRFGIPGGIDFEGTERPVSKVQATFTEGGLLLSIFLHHALADGASLRVFLEGFGNQTRNISTHLPSDQNLPSTGIRPYNVPSRKLSDIDLSSYRRLTASCHEYTTLHDLTGPTQPRYYKLGTPMPEIERIGRIFVFTTERLQELRELVRTRNGTPELPTAYTSLAALAFAHVTDARIKSDTFLTGIAPSQTSVLWNSVNWRTRAFHGTTDNYFGNAALPVLTRVSREQLTRACHGDADLAQVAPMIKESIELVDEEYVSRRQTMMSLAPSPQMIGVNYDPRSPESLAFNTWRHFGADVEWNIPGVPVTKPDAIRRGSGGWNLGTALLLPARADAPQQELFISLSVESMNLLCHDERWMRWVDRIIG
ncbi:hypothetical protein F5Y18DRAFT_258749 [Xylariaceae sp. FL1019]|nr:hypothetical protein F5Y18DRAFT_258749 [Xylariaceae sp. FL1019]